MMDCCMLHTLTYNSCYKRRRIRANDWSGNTRCKAVGKGCQSQEHVVRASIVSIPSRPLRWSFNHVSIVLPLKLLPPTVKRLLSLKPPAQKQSWTTNKQSDPRLARTESVARRKTQFPPLGLLQNPKLRLCISSLRAVVAWSHVKILVRSLISRFRWTPSRT